MNSQEFNGFIRDIGQFKVHDYAIPYVEFVPKLYNFCLSLGFEDGFIMPSRAFCSDENQGMPILLISRHFGTFPFDHGEVGGMIALDRHGPHATHGEDSVIIQASHVGYDPETKTYGQCNRPKMHGSCKSSSCGKITHVIEPYIKQYKMAQNRIFLHRSDSGDYLITVKDSFIDFHTSPVQEGLVLNLQNIVRKNGDGSITPVATHSTSHTYEVSDDFRRRINETGYEWQNGVGLPMDFLLTADLFSFRRADKDISATMLERNLIEFMPAIVTHKSPQLKAAKINVQREFARTVESIHRGTEYKGKNLLYIAGLNLDISGYQGHPETTYFVPWAAHIQLKGSCPSEYIHPLEQDRLFAKLSKQSSVNNSQTTIKDQIDKMLHTPRYDIYTPRQSNSKDISE